MTEWVERIEQHSVHATLDSFESVLSSAEAKGEGMKQVPYAITRLRHVVEFAKRTLSRVDPLLLGTGTLDKLNGVLTQVVTHLNQFMSDGKFAHINNANTEADKVLPRLAALLVPNLPEDIEGIRSVVAAFSRATTEQVEKLCTETEQGKESLHALHTDVQQLHETITKEKVRVDETVAQHQRQFSELQNSRQQNFEDAETKRMQKSDDTINRAREKLIELEADCQR